MAKKHSGIGKAAVIAAGAGAAAYAVKKHKELSQEGKTLTGQLKEKAIQTAEKSIKMPVPDPAYRNTERGMHERNSKGIYYSNGNYEACLLYTSPSPRDCS